jgi:hypothetical protein
MTPEKIALVQDSFAKVAPIADHAAVLFYDGDARRRRHRVDAARNRVACGQRAGQEARDLRRQGRALRNRRRGSAVDAGERAWTADVAEAWTTAYGTLSGYMISEAHGAQAAE